MHKSQYFTEDSIDHKAREMLAEVKDLRAQHPLNFNPRRAALLVLDMQNYFFDESSHAYVPSSHAILPRVVRLIEVFQEMNRPVVFTRHLNTDTDAGMMSRWWRDLVREGTPRGEILRELHSSECPVIYKTQYDAFHETELEDMLRKSVIVQVVVCGVMTHLCCETTARSAFMRGFEVLFAVDGTATYNEAFHMATLRNLAHGFAVPVLVEDVVSALREGT